MCRDAELAARDYVSLVLSAADSIADVSVLQSVLAQSAAAVRRFADPAWRSGGLEPPRGLACGARLYDAEPGSDRQLVYARALARVATTLADLALLAGLLAGSERIEGLAVDTEFRWLLLRRLVSRGTAGPAEIDAELDSDRTDAGERHAASCRASIPDPAAKEDAWAQIISSDLPNAVFRAMLDGFTDADYDHAELLKPYGQRFFDEVGRVWSEWGSDMAQWFAEKAYPGEITPEAIAAADDYLARSDPPPPLRRLLTAGRDDDARARRGQQRDAAAG